MNDKKLDCGYILKLETGFPMDSMWGMREIEKPRRKT